MLQKLSYIRDMLHTSKEQHHASGQKSFEIALPTPDFTASLFTHAKKRAKRVRSTGGWRVEFVSEASKKNRKAVDIFENKWTYQALSYVIALTITAPPLDQFTRLEQWNLSGKWRRLRRLRQLQEKRGESRKSRGPSDICRICAIRLGKCYIWL